MDCQVLRTTLVVAILLLTSLKVTSATNCSLPIITGDSVVREGDFLFLQCSCNGSTWTLNDQELPANAVVDEDGVTIEEADHSVHSGSYVCISDGVASDVFQVVVQYLSTDISICEVYNNGEVLEGTHSPYRNNYFYSSFVGSNVTLKCCSEGEPTPNITWDLHHEYSNVVRYSNNNSLLIIDSLQAFGEFTCTATNPAGSVTSNFIHLLAGIEIEEETLTVFTPRHTVCGKIGGAVSIKCIVAAPAGTTVKWLFDNIDILDSYSGYSIDDDNTLTILDISLMDAGIYTCSASANGHRSQSERIQLDLDCIHSVTLVPQNVTVGLGHDLTLTCDVSKSEYLFSPLTVMWITPNIANYTGPTLTIDSVQYQDGGVYQCIVTTDNALTANSSNIVYVEGPPTVEIVANEREAKLNHELILTCITNATSPSQFEWHRREINGTSPEQLVSRSSTIRIARFDHSDIGTYRCTVHNGIHLKVQASIDVVLTKDIYLFEPGSLGNQTILINHSANIACDIYGGEGSVNVFWYNGSTPITTNTRAQIIDRTDSHPSMLNINSLSLSDEGQYFCVAHDEESRKFNHSFFVIVEIPGRIRATVPSVTNVTVTVGSMVLLQCISDGKPKPSVEWRMRTVFLNTGSRHMVDPDNGTLIIYHAEVEDSSEYTCLFSRCSTCNTVEDMKFTLNVVSREEEESTEESGILGLQTNVFIAIVLGAVAGFFLLLTCLLICCFCCSKCCRALKNCQNRPASPVTRLEVTTFERRPSMRGSTRKDNSGILQSTANARWSLSSDARSNTNTVAMTTASSSLAISPAPPVPSPVPPPAGPTASLATEVVLPPGVNSFPRQNLKLGNVMGEGEFGPVYRATARKISPHEDESIVAVKILMPREGDEDYRPDVAVSDFASQMKLSSDYVASIVGICADAEPYYVIYQYLSEGDLKKFLTTHRPSPQLQPVLTQADLMHIITQVSHGMSYLYSQQIIHGDLASRNCLIGADLSIKIADLGIGHDLYPSDYYDNGTQLLPIRWMAAELLVESTEGPAFSLASDVWAFGIFCWEVFTYGRQPYDSMNDEQVLRLVPHGHLLNSPEEGCPPLLFSLMQDCWSSSPDQRPSFSEITAAILSIDVD